MYLEKRWVQFVAIFLLAFVWGSSFILMKIGLKTFSSSQAAAIRIVSASLVLFPVALRHLKLLKRKDIKSLLIAGFVGSFFPAFLFMKAETQISSAMAGMLNSLTPVFTMIIGLFIYRLRVLRVQIIGLIIGLLGAAGLITSGELVSLGSVNSYVFYIVLATLCYGININEIKAHLSHLTGIQITSFSFAFLLPVASFYLFTSDFASVPDSPDWELHLLALVILGVLGTALAMLLMNSLIRYISPLFASSVTYIIPIFAIAWGLFDGEQIRPLHLLFMALILMGVYLINTKKKIDL